MQAKPYRFRLYVVGGQVGSERAEPDLRAALDACLPGQYELETIDLRARPDLARADRVLVAPTVIRLAPPPSRRAAGNLDDAEALIEALALPPRGR